MTFAARFFRSIPRRNRNFYPFAFVVLALLNGCGEVEWFPEYVRQPTTPDPFSFAAKTGVEKSKEVTSASITVKGLTAATSPISVTGSIGSASKYSINGATATDAAGTVKNDDVVTVTHTSASTIGTTTTSTLTIGSVSANFSSTTRYIESPSFGNLQAVNGYMRTYADITSLDGVAGTHEIKIRDSASSVNAQFTVTDTAIVPSDSQFSNATRTVSILNGQRLWVRNLISTINTPATTTITIDGVDYPVTLTPTP